MIGSMRTGEWSDRDLSMLADYDHVGSQDTSTAPTDQPLESPQIGLNSGVISLVLAEFQRLTWRMLLMSQRFHHLQNYWAQDRHREKHMRQIVKRVSHTHDQVAL